MSRNSARLICALPAERAEVTRQTLYRHWPTRAVLLFDLVLEGRGPGPGQVRVRAEACGPCPIDVHATYGDRPVGPSHPPFVPGTSGVGLVEKLGAGVTHLGVGRRVAVPWLGRACGRCCRTRRTRPTCWWSAPGAAGGASDRDRGGSPTGVFHHAAGPVAVVPERT